MKKEIILLSMLLILSSFVSSYSLEQLSLESSYKKSFATIIYVTITDDMDSIRFESDGSIIYAKAEGWDRNRIDANTVTLTNISYDTNRILLIVDDASILEWYAGESKGSINITGRELSLILPILNIDNPERDISIIKPYLRSNDIVVFPPGAYKYVKELKNEIDGLKIGTGGISIDPLLKGIKKIPSDIDYITYDYEPDFTPEFTSEQDKSIELFKQLYGEVKKYDKGLIIVPVYVYGKDWDWGEVAKHTDIIIVQVQNFQRGFIGPEEFKPTNIGMDLKAVARELIAEIRAKAPDTKIYLQMGFTYGPSADDLFADIQDIKDLDIDGIALWYNPGTVQASAKINELAELLSRIRPN